MKIPSKGLTLLFDIFLIVGILILGFRLFSWPEKPPQGVINPFHNYPFSSLTAIDFPQNKFQLRLKQEGREPVLILDSKKTFAVSMRRLQAYLDHFLILPEFNTFRLEEEPAAYGFPSQPQIRFKFGQETLDIHLGSTNKLTDFQSYLWFNEDLAAALPAVLVQKMKPRLEEFLPLTLRAYIPSKSKTPQRMKSSTGAILDASTKNQVDHISTLLKTRGVIRNFPPTSKELVAYSLEFSSDGGSTMITGLIGAHGIFYTEVLDGYWLSLKLPPL